MDNVPEKTMQHPPEYVIEMLHITKDFPGIRANDDVSLQLKKGEIHALLGENGAGKTTLMGVLFGLYSAEKGEIRKNGKAVRIHNPNDANALGIGMVHQHFKLVHNFTVLENIVLGVETTKGGVLRMDEAREKITALSKQYGLMVDPDARIEDITVGMQQRVEILKMLYRENEILIFDEPTAVLTPQEIDELMKIMKNLTSEGKSILFITHKLNEIKQVADRCTVLRKGRCVGAVEVADATREQMSEMMVGRKVEFEIRKAPMKAGGKAALVVQNLTVRSKHQGKNQGKPKAHNVSNMVRMGDVTILGIDGFGQNGKPSVNNVSFTVRQGEILCIAGIDGNGQSELVYALAGLLTPDSGRIFLGDEEITRDSIRQRNDAGLSHIPEDRHRHGLVLDYTLAENLILKSYHKPAFQKNGFLRFDRSADYADRLIADFDIRSGQGARTPARSMSGGNQQKAIVAREICEDPKVLIAVQPTRGLDVGAIEYIHGRIVAARDEGKAVLLVSLELEEVLSISDRILVIYEGEIVADLDAAGATAQELGLYMAGSRKGEVV